MNVLVVAEDFRKDQYVLRPIIKALLADLGRHQANVRVMTDPLLGGLAKALALSGEQRGGGHRPAGHGSARDPLHPRGWDSLTAARR